MRLFTSLGTFLVTSEAAFGTGGKKHPKPSGFKPGYTFDFQETKTEKANGWSLSDRCGQAALSGSKKDQRNDPNCPNVILMNSDDMAWGDLSINNPSKLIPTPNLDRLVSKGINFRDGHACTARCAPSRYCLMTGRYHFRRGDYHYKPMILEYGRKILPQLFKRNNYHTMVVGKPQPVEEQLDKQEHFFVEGTRFWGYDQSYTSRSYCCLPGGGYFEDDYPVSPFNRWAIFTEFRDESSASLWLQDEKLEKEFFDNPKNWHFLDGYYEGGNPANKKIKNTYKAYWTAIEKGIHSGLSKSGARRRRSANGQIYKRFTRNKRNAKDHEKLIDEVLPPKKGGKSKKNYMRFMEKDSHKVVVANYRVKDGAVTKFDEKTNYEFAVDKISFADKQDATDAIGIYYDEMKARGASNNVLTDIKNSKPKLTQLGFDSEEIMHRFHQKAIDYVTDHVNDKNPVKAEGENLETNQPFYLYLSFRAPHRPSSHNLTYDENNPTEHLPHASIGKPGEQLGLFDEYIGNVMKALHDLEVADNTLIFFTSDNGPDQGAFNMANRYGHMRLTAMRGKKASVYEAGHRVPFLSWWPLGTHRANWGTNYDLPVGQVDLFSTFADIMNYPLPGKEKCIYAFNSDNAANAGHDPASLGRPAKKSQTESSRNYCTRIDEFLQDDGTYTGPSYGYDSAVQIRSSKDGSADYLVEKKDWYEKSETWKTIEDKTGFLVGWDGCMAEDSQSFAAAFKAEKVSEYVRESDGKTVHQFKNSLQQVPSRIYAGKLGDLSLRLGRYKLVRFNAPKDLRTGPNRQHLTAHEGTLWHANKETKRACQYNDDGSKIDPDCEIEKLCRDHTTFGHTFCMRDHYYQLWDLEKNFGEKTLCDDTLSEKMNPNKALELTLMSSFMDRGFFGDGTGAKKPAEKPTDRWGFGTGVESTPFGINVNDCCILNLDEKTLPNDTRKKRSVEKIRSKRSSSRQVYNCGQMRVKLKGVEKKTAGWCKPNPAFKRQAGTTWETQRAWMTKTQNRFMNTWNFASIHGWTVDPYFNWPTEAGLWEGGSCTFAKTGLPGVSKNNADGNHIFDEESGEWRHISVADRLCWNGKDGSNEIKTTKAPSTTKNPTKPNPDFKLGCKVPDHNGPLGEGWEANEKYREDSDRHQPGLKNGDISSDDFGKWSKFTDCMKNVMKILEGQAYFPEILVEKIPQRVGYSAVSHPDLKPHEDSGDKLGKEISDDMVMAGFPVGESQFAQNNIKNLFSAVKDSDDSGTTRFHGGGSRFIENKNGEDALINKCIKYLPSNAPAAMDIAPNFDLEMNLMGWLKSEDNTGGGSHSSVQELVVDEQKNGSVVYKDERKLQKYYESNSNGEYLYKFSPQYNPKY